MQVDIDRFQGICNCGREHEVTVQGIWIEEGATDRLYQMLTEEEELGDFISPVIVWDDNTKEATKDIMEDIEDICLEDICLDSENLKADNYGIAILLENIPEDTDLIIAVGAGTIHDLCRYVADKIKVPFISVPTAASMDGYVSNVAAVTIDGMKRTLLTKGPEYVFADTAIFKAAPYRLTASGVADIIGKYTALADWKIAHLITGEYYCEEIVSLEYDVLSQVKDVVKNIGEGDTKAFESLMHGLILSGLAMQMIGSSRPASCSEHHLAHLWEMDIINSHTDALYGERVAVATLAVRKRYDEISHAIRAGRIRVRACEELESDLLKDTFGKKNLYREIIDENTPDPLLEVNPERLLEALPEIADIIDEIPDTDTLETLLKAAGCKTSLTEISLPADIEKLSLRLSPYVKNRLSLLRVSKMLQDF